MTGKQRTISPIFPQPNNTSIGVANLAMTTFGTEFWKFYRHQKSGIRMRA